MRNIKSCKPNPKAYTAAKHESKGDLDMAGRLDGKVAIITGGASGMGLATVRRFVEEGAKVVVADVTAEAADTLNAELGDSIRFRLCDVSKEEDVEFGGLNCMFNNAGFGGVSADELELLDLGDKYRYTVDVLFTGVLSGIKHASRVMKATGSGGSIINTASVAGLRGGWGPHVYSAMKAAVINLSKSTSLELGPHGIRVNAICPGFIATAIFAGEANINWEQKMKFISILEQSDTNTNMGYPIQRPGVGKDIANTALFLASDDSTFVTGQAIAVDGGLTAGQRRQREPGEESPFEQLVNMIQAGE